jgi:hypothetical protein
MPIFADDELEARNREDYGMKRLHDGMMCRS